MIGGVINKLKNWLFPGESRVAAALEHYVASVGLVWLAILVYRTNPYYVGFLREDTQTALLYLAIVFSVVSVPYYSLRKVEASKGLTVVKLLGRMWRDGTAFVREFTTGEYKDWPKVSPEEKTAILFLVVKLFFLPIMLNFLFGNLDGLYKDVQVIRMQNYEWSYPMAVRFYYPMAIALLFAIDTGYFAFGYMFEAGWLGNKVRSVEPTALGWAVALASYPPFNNLVGQYAPWHSNYYTLGSDEVVATGIRVLILVLVAGYVWATVSLGTKCSNLTNRGIVTTGAYRWVRHPAYVCKNLSWWLALVPVMSWGAFVSMAVWSVIYWLRAITEERHLSADPDYRAYCKQVPYRFVPGVW